MTRRATQDELPIDGAPGIAVRGQVYKDTCLQIRTLVKAGDVDEDREAGTIGQARSLAAVIDRASGLAGRKQETYALPQLHKQLAELLDRLAGRATAGTEVTALLEAIANPVIHAGGEDDQA